MPAEFDHRVTPVRPDLAAAELKGLVEAPRFVEGRPMQVTEASAPLRRAPATDAPLETEALFGEWVTVYDESEGWGWVQLERDRYVGYLPAFALGPRTEPTTGWRRCAPTPIPVRRSSSRRTWRCRLARGPRSSDRPATSP